MESIKKIVSRGSFSGQLGESVQKALIIEWVKTIIRSLIHEVGDEDLTIVSVRGGVLHIACSSSVIIHEIKLNEAKIIREIKNKFPASIVTSIRCSIIA